MSSRQGTHLYTERNAVRTFRRIETYEGLKALLQTWEEQPIEIQLAEREYIKELRARLRQEHNYLLHRSDPAANV